MLPGSGRFSPSFWSEGFVVIPTSELVGGPEGGYLVHMPGNSSS